MYIVSNVRVELEEKDLRKVIAKKLNINKQDILKFSYYKKSVDSRDKEHLFFLCHFLVEVNQSREKKIIKNKDVKLYKPYTLELKKVKSNDEVVVVGMGPAGLFASYILALAGVKVLLIERGKMVEDRVKDVNDFFNGKGLNLNSNLQYGEGGAGTFSDGKLTTNINDEKIEFIKETFIKFGANEEIRYLAKPHIGSDVLLEVVKNFRNELLRLGVKIKFNTTLIDIKTNNNSLEEIILKENDKDIYSYKCNRLFLGCGHSARDIFFLLNRHQVYLERKPFSIGVRIEHLQEEINKAQYGMKYYNHPSLANADYKIAVHLDNNRSLHSFCMCPGGVVVNSSSEKEGIVTNGMSYFKRDKENANSALLVNVNDSDLKEGLFAGVDFQREYEQLAYKMSNSHKIPCQLLGDFINNRKSTNFGKVKPSSPSGVVLTNIRECLPSFVTDTLLKGIPLIDKKIHGFNDKDALLSAIETRSSSPIRIVRDNEYQTNIKGIFPIGEGSGYSSGITTSALDGIRVALKLIDLLA